MCPVSAALMTAALMRSADRLPIIPAVLSLKDPDDGCGFFRSGLALSITPFTLANLMNLILHWLWPRFFVRLGGVSPSRPDFAKAAAGAAVNTGRRPPA